MGKSMKRNAFLNTIKTLLKIIFPLITIPYISRVLNVDNVGKFNFSMSIVSYFVLIAQLGIDTFAVREGARFRDSRKKLSEFASKIFTINIFSTIVSYILLVLCLLTISSLDDYSLCIMILSIQIIFNTLGCEWIYTIYEEYKYITYRTIFIQIVSLISLFVFVKTENDLIIYCFITLISSSGANILNIINLKKYCDLKIKIDRDAKKFLIPILFLFVNSIATTIYVNSDITLIGIYSSDYSVGLYSISSKVYSTINTLLAALIIVSIPRLSYLIGKNKLEEYTALSSKIINSLIFLVLPTVVGVICMAEKIIYIIGGQSYIEGALSLKVLGFSSIFSIFSWFYTSCVLIPSKREKEVLVATSIAAIINIILNIILIPKFSLNAAAFTTIIAESISLFICYYKSKKIINIGFPIKNILKTLIGCIGIYIYCYIVNAHFAISHFYGLMVGIMGSVLIYGVIELILKNEILVFYFNLAKNRIRKS